MISNFIGIDFGYLDKDISKVGAPFQLVIAAKFITFFSFGSHEKTIQQFDEVNNTDAFVSVRRIESHTTLTNFYRFS